VKIVYACLLLTPLRRCSKLPAFLRNARPNTREKVTRVSIILGGATIATKRPVSAIMTRLVNRRVGDIRDVLNSILILYRGAHIVGKLTGDLDGIDAPDIAVETLPLGHP
jgi:hypothetical protein